MRSMYTTAVLEAITARPGIRAAEIADEVGCDIEAVERSISYEITSGAIIRELVEIAYGRSTCAFRMRPPASPPVKAPAPIRTGKTRPKRAAPPPKKPAARAYLGQFMCALRANGELHLALGEALAMRLTPEQTRQVQALFGEPA